MAERMLELAASQPGCPGVESVWDGDGLGVTVSCWETEGSIGGRGGRSEAEDREAQREGEQRKL